MVIFQRAWRMSILRLIIIEVSPPVQRIDGLISEPFDTFTRAILLSVHSMLDAVVSIFNGTGDEMRNVLCASPSALGRLHDVLFDGVVGSLLCGVLDGVAYFAPGVCGFVFVGVGVRVRGRERCGLYEGCEREKGKGIRNSCFR